jgi:hypothetical protein
MTFMNAHSQVDIPDMSFARTARLLIFATVGMSISLKAGHSSGSAREMVVDVTASLEDERISDLTTSKSSQPVLDFTDCMQVAHQQFAFCVKTQKIVIMALWLRDDNLSNLTPSPLWV